MGSFNELYSNFGYYQAIPADVYAGAITGNTIDLQDFGGGAVLFAVAINSFASAGACLAANEWRFLLMQGLASVDGTVSAWSLVGNSQIIHNVMGGYDSTASTGLWFALNSVASLGGIYGTSTMTSGNGVIFVGYKQHPNYRFVRLYVSVSGAPSAAWMAGICIVGNVPNWPVQSPV